MSNDVSLPPVLPEVETLPLEGESEEGKLLLYRNVTNDPEVVFQALLNELAWQQDRIRIGGREIPIPRLQAWYGEPHCLYTYSGLTLQPRPWTPLLVELRAKAEALSQARFNCVLCNLYRDGQDSVGWHADDEPELGQNPTIASYSFGAERRFLMKPKKGKARASALQLPHNSCLIMQGDLQHHWRHQLPKTTRPVGKRVNLTFRYIVSEGETHN